MKVKLERTRAKLAEQRRISEPVQDLLQAEAKRLLERTTVDSNSESQGITHISHNSVPLILALYKTEKVFTYLSAEIFSATDSQLKIKI